MDKGLIIKAISGFFYVKTADGRVLSCKAKGAFRKEGVVPLVGDMVLTDQDTVVEILPRKNTFLRPAAANIDLALMIVSSHKPQPNPVVLDRLIAICEEKKMETALIITKSDQKRNSAFGDIYRQAGFPVIETGLGIDNLSDIFALMEGKVSMLIGNTGAGKSTLLNRLFPELSIETGEISQKLGRGRHTTRHIQLYPIPGGGYIADTPGFGTVEVEKYGRIRKEELQYCFREFSPYLGKCRFQDCSHRSEKGCAVLDAVKAGKIPCSRHQSYVAMYEEAAKIKDWET